eukprot:3341488-Amphidinium_carterae.2
MQYLRRKLRESMEMSFDASRWNISCAFMSHDALRGMQQESSQMRQSAELGAERVFDAEREQERKVMTRCALSQSGLVHGHSPYAMEHAKCSCPVMLWISHNHLCPVHKQHNGMSMASNATKPEGPVKEDPKHQQKVAYDKCLASNALTWAQSLRRWENCVGSGLGSACCGGDGCAFDLSVQGLSGRNCSGRHEHQPCRRKIEKESANYPAELVDCIHRSFVDSTSIRDRYASIVKAGALWRRPQNDSDNMDARIDTNSDTSYAMVMC